MTRKRPYLDFYEELGDHLVSRVIEDEDEFFRTRSALYLSLGIPTTFISGKRVLEFGPGSGHNSIFTATLSPAEYVLVDGGREILNAAKHRLSSFVSPHTTMSYVCTLFEEFTPQEPFDFVFAEACIPMQENPPSLLRHISRHVKSGGLLVITTISAVSYLSEILRRLGRDILISPRAKPEDQLKILRPVYKQHIESLTGVSRSVDDWLLDNIVQPFDVQQLLTVPQAISVLGDRFEIFGSSPRFVTDWRWYKMMNAMSKGFNKQALDSYYSRNANLLDYRIENLNHDIEIGILLEDRCSRIWDVMIDLENGQEQQWEELWKSLAEVEDVVSRCAPDTLPALQEAILWLKNGASESLMPNFEKWWGRGQQYVSFVCNI